jgi:transcriptional/translational regulatory protein YebC/TACO1
MEIADESTKKRVESLTEALEELEDVEQVAHNMV